MTSQAPFRSLKRNYFFSAVSAVLGIAYPLVTMAYVARALGPEFLGKYYFANSLAAYFLFAAGMGIPVYGNREVARAGGNRAALGKVFTELFLIGLAASAVALALYAGTVAAVPQFRAESAIMAIFGLLFVSNAFAFDYVYAGLERQDSIVLRSAASKLVSIVLILIFVRGPEDYLAFAGITVGASALNATLMLGVLRHASLRNLASLEMRRHLKPLMHILGSLLFLNIYLMLDTVILGLLSGPHEVGLYGSVVKPCRAVALLAASLAAAALPRLTYYAGENRSQDSFDLQRKSFEMLCLVAVPAFMFSLAASARIVVLISGPEFSEAGPTLMLAAPLILTNSLSAFISYQLLLPFGKERLFLAASGLLAVVSIVANFALVPALGRHGTVLAALFAEVAFLVFLHARLRRGGTLRALRSPHLWKYAAAAGASAAFLFAAGGPSDSSLEFLGTCAAAAALYAVLLWLLKEPVSHQIVRLLRARLVPAGRS